MNTFVSLPSRGVSIPISSIDRVIRTTPWQPLMVNDPKVKWMNEDGRPLTVTILYGYDREDEDLSVREVFTGQDAIRMNAFFFQECVYCSQEDHGMMAVLDTEARVGVTARKVPVDDHQVIQDDMVKPPFTPQPSTSQAQSSSESKRASWPPTAYERLQAEHERSQAENGSKPGPAASQDSKPVNPELLPGVYPGHPYFAAFTWSHLDSMMKEGKISFQGLIEAFEGTVHIPAQGPVRLFDILRVKAKERRVALEQNMAPSSR